MYRSKRPIVLLTAAVLAPWAALEGATLLSPGDFIIAVDDTPLSASNSPATEGPANVANGTNAKYLNFGKENSGFIATPPGGPFIIRSIQITTANDAEPRDPASYAIYGTNDAITSPNNSLGNQENWTLISEGPVTLPTTRNTLGPLISFDNAASYASYRVLFPTLKNTVGANSMQVAEVALRTTPDESGPNILLGSSPILGIDTDVFYGGFVAGERPPNAIDADSGTQYRNIGGANAGFIVTPWVGPTIVESFTLTTPADAPEQDPAAWALYGTNDPVTDLDNSQGNLETWTLIGSGALDLPTSRLTAGTEVAVANATAYTSYRMLFTSLRDSGATSMHIGDIQFSGTIVNPVPTELLKPGDFIIAIDTDTTAISQSNFPGGEGPANIVDNSTTTKYLNFGEAFSGFIVTPGGGAATTVRSMVITTANDAVERDPASFVIYGTNDPITSLNNSFGDAENWTQIAEGPLALPEERQTRSPAVSFENSTAYTSYRVVFPTVKNQAAANSMQISEVELYESSDGTGADILDAAGTVVLAIDFDSTPTSSYPAGESPPNAIDRLTNKYLNFGEVNSGFIVTPSNGLTVVNSFRVITANDAIERDPTGWALYGTNDPISSVDNSQGDRENWTLIGSGTMALPLSRWASGPLISFSNSAPYTSYRMVFTDVRNSAAANSMQIREIQFYGSIGLPCPTPFPDIDEDGDVDQDDYAVFQTCYTGESGAPIDPLSDCRCLDRDKDTDVDAADLVEFNKCISGPEVPWNLIVAPDCAPG